MKRITEIEITKSETWIISQPRQHLRPPCRKCGAETARMFKPEEAAIIVGVSLREIFRLLERDAVHFEETLDGAIYVCPRLLAPDALNTLAIITEEKL